MHAPLSIGTAGPHPVRRSLAIVLVALLLAAQTAAVVHGADVERHLGPDTCHTCVLVAGTHAGLLPGLALLIPRGDGLLPVVPLIETATTRQAPAFHSRAPPAPTR